MREGIGWWAWGEGAGTATVIGAKAATSVKSFKAQTVDSNTAGLFPNCMNLKIKTHS